MPLPDTAGGLEWSSLVSAAKAYEGKEARKESPQICCCCCCCNPEGFCASAAAQRAVSLFSLTEPQPGAADGRPATSPVQFHTPQTPRTTPTFSGCDRRAARRFRDLVQADRVSNVSLLLLLQGRGAQRTVFPAPPPGGDVTTAQHRFRESERRWFFPLFCRLFEGFRKRRAVFQTSPCPRLLFVCLRSPRRSRIKWFCWQRWPT